jgi:DtxR family Mn-dependent transcriptional regulator
MSVSIDNFLKAIYKIQVEEMENATSTRLAQQLGISNAAITDMAKNLSKKSLVRYKKYKAVELSTEGKIQALKIIRKHRLWELFLMQVLDYSWLEVHQDAEMLEHQTSDFLLERLDQFLGQPTFDPHGEPIPDSQGNLPDSEVHSKLTSCMEEKEYVIMKINPVTHDLTLFFQENGFQPGKKLLLKKKYEDLIEIVLEETKIAIPKSVAGKLYVKPK